MAERTALLVGGDDDGRTIRVPSEVYTGRLPIIVTVQNEISPLDKPPVDAYRTFETVTYTSRKIGLPVIGDVRVWGHPDLDDREVKELAWGHCLSRVAKALIDERQ